MLFSFLDNHNFSVHIEFLFETLCISYILLVFDQTFIIAVLELSAIDFVAQIRNTSDCACYIANMYKILI